MDFIVRAAGLSDVGKVRSRNEDRWLVLDEEQCYLLADGLGGHVAGDVAAETAVDLFAQYLRKQWLPAVRKGEEPRESLIAGIRMVHRRLRDKARAEPGLMGMGTTLCALSLLEGEALYAHVGDSRIYQLRGGRLKALTQDHSLASALEDEGRCKEAETANALYSNVVLQALGASEEVRPSIGAISLQSGDRFLLCSDGLTDMLSDVQIEKVLGQPLRLHEVASQLIGMACTAGGRDNVTVVLVEVVDGIPGANLPR